ncbi:MAG: mechanosensitive ion channel [Leptolyngbyaceae cyanobacterium SL_5_9]|nr:mechanosensitive ion channel [Leptolyngbyaceae cyanobacterium SL_5_9]NJO72326.1 mechanosensitive ion channel [Leptolyngbyaceae cyanobacterium RM1_406_9]
MLDSMRSLLTHQSIEFGLVGLVLGVVLVLSVNSILLSISSDRSDDLLNRYLQDTPLGSLYLNFIQPNGSLLFGVVTIALTEILILLLPNNEWTDSLEVLVSLLLAIATSWLVSRLFKDFFNLYLLNAAAKRGRKISSELLILAKWIANITIVLVAILLFAQTHHINIVGVLASLGIGGLAVAFAAQKTLEQVLGGIVLYLDRPFGVDDYIGLPDGTFGRVESIGLRSTRIRMSGKGTVMIVPNSSLTQVNIENFTGAKKVMSILYLKFYRIIDGEEKALIRQIILESADDIFGIDSRNTEVTFQENVHSAVPNITQAQVTFFILGSGEVSMELRRQLLDIATRTITQRLKEYDIAFEIEDPTIYVDAPITI